MRHHFRRPFIAILLTFLSILLLFSSVLAYMITQPIGGKLLVRYFKKDFASVGLMHIGHYEGTLQDGFVLREVVIKGISYLPHAVVDIQEIKVHLPLWNLLHSDVNIFNARLYFPNSDPLVFTGRIAEGKIQGNLYGKSMDLHEAFRFWPGGDISQSLQGFVSSSDFTVSGPLNSPQIKGSFVTDEIRYKATRLDNLFSSADLTLYATGKDLIIKGQIGFDLGTVTIRKVKFDLLPSKFIFNGDIFNPVLDLHMASKVEDMDFHLNIKGPSVLPEMTVSSDPPMAPQQALQILFTGNAFSSSTSPLSGGVTSSELAQNFLNYSFHDMNDEQFGLKTKLTNNLKLGVEVDQMPIQPGATNVYYSRKINGEMDMNEHMSLNVSQEVMPQSEYPSTTSTEDTQPHPETQIYLQYKKRF